MDLQQESTERDDALQRESDTAPQRGAPDGELHDQVTFGEDDGGARAMLDDPDTLRRRWESVQVRFVDDPQTSVREADELVATTLHQLTDAFNQQRARLEATWDTGSDVSTEELRHAFQGYRDFFGRLLAA